MMGDTSMQLKKRPGRERRLTAWVCAFVLIASSGAAQTTADDLAHTHFESGAAYLEQADYESALREFSAAYDLSKRPEILINMATVYERLGQLDQAVASLQHFLDQAPNDPHADTIKIRVENLKKRAAEKSGGAPVAPVAGAGAAAPAPTDTAAQPPPPVAPTPVAPPPVATAPAAATEPTPPPVSHHGSRVPAYVLFAAGGAFAVGSVITGILAANQHSHDKSTCSPDCSDSQLSSGRTLAATSTVLTGAAIVAGAVGTVLFFGNAHEDQATSTKPRVGVGAAPGTVAASASFRF
jgi:hypothetical protein